MVFGFDIEGALKNTVEWTKGAASGGWITGQPQAPASQINQTQNITPTPSIQATASPTPMGSKTNEMWGNYQKTAVAPQNTLEDSITGFVDTGRGFVNTILNNNKQTTVTPETKVLGSKAEQWMNVDNERIKAPFLSRDQYAPQSQSTESRFTRPFMSTIPENRIVPNNGLQKNDMLEQARSTFAKSPLGAALVGTPEEKVKANGGNQNMVMSKGSNTLYPTANSKTLFEDPIGFTGKVLLSAWETKDTMASPLGMVSGTTELKSAGIASKVAMKGLESGLPSKIASRLSSEQVIPKATMHIDDIANMGKKLFTQSEAFPTVRSGVGLGEELFTKPKIGMIEQKYAPTSVGEGQKVVDRVRKGLNINIEGIGAPSSNYNPAGRTQSLSSSKVPDLFKKTGSDLFNIVGEFGKTESKRNQIKSKNKYSSGFMGAFEQASPKKQIVNKPTTKQVHTSVVSAIYATDKQKPKTVIKQKKNKNESWMDVAFRK